MKNPRLSSIVAGAIVGATFGASAVLAWIVVEALAELVHGAGGVIAVGLALGATYGARRRLTPDELRTWRADR